MEPHSNSSAQGAQVLPSLRTTRMAMLLSCVFMFVGATGASVADAKLTNGSAIPLPLHVVVTPTGLAGAATYGLENS